MNSEMCLPESLLEENWSWVDQCLEEKYYGYALTADNCDEYLAAGLLREKWAWMDYDLENQFHREEEADMRILCPAPLSWVYYKETTNNAPLERENYTRDRAESDISDHSDEVDRVMNRLTKNNYAYSLSCSDSDYDINYDCDGYDSF